MEKKYTLWQRITSDTPSFFKKVQILGAGLVTLSISLTGIGIIPVAITAVMATVGTTVAAVAQFAVKQTELGNTSTNETK